MGKTPAQRAAKHGNKAGRTPADQHRPGSTTARHSVAGSNRTGRSTAGGVGAASTKAPSRMYMKALNRGPQTDRKSVGMVLIALAATSAVLYAYGAFLALPDLATMAGGRAMPDTLVTGYGLDYIEQVRAAMSTPARNIYAHFHSTADLIFPLLFALTWLVLLTHFVRRGVLRWVLFAVPILYAVTDLMENAAIDHLFSADSVSAGEVDWASGLTIAKFILFGLCLVAAMIAVVVNARYRRSAPHPAGPAGTGNPRA